MKKKIFTPKNSIFITAQVFLWIFISLSIVCVVLNSINVNHGFKDSELILTIISSIAFLYCLWSLFAYNIIIKEKEIICHGDGLPKFLKGQHKCKIEFKNIADIKIISSLKDSQNKKRKVKWSFPRRFIEFTLNNGQKERILILYFSKKQIIKLLQQILIYMKINNNNIELNTDKIMIDWISYSKSRHGKVSVYRLSRNKKEALLKEIEENENSNKKR